MGQDATKVLMGSTRSSSKQGSEVFADDPATYKAGLAVRRNSSGLLSLAVGDGRWVGISLGKSLSDHKKTTVLQAGEQVPVLLEGGPARGVVTITSYANLVATSNDTLKIGATTFTFKASPSTSSEVGAVTSNNQTATNLAAKINAHGTAGALFKAVAVGPVVTITAKDNTTDGTTVDLVYTDTHSEIGLTVDDVTFTGGADASDFVVIGANVYFSDTTGKADDPNSGASISNAVYVSAPLTGIDEDGNEVYAAIIDMAGGL
jgi:hypothetical protein